MNYKFWIGEQRSGIIVIQLLKPINDSLLLSPKKITWIENQTRNNHFQWNATMLIGVFKITYIMIVIIDIGQDKSFFAKI
jgi:hypothetical protein